MKTIQEHCAVCGRSVSWANQYGYMTPEEDLYWEYPDWPGSCLLVCTDCVQNDEE